VPTVSFMILLILASGLLYAVPIKERSVRRAARIGFGLPLRLRAPLTSSPLTLRPAHPYVAASN
jgi:hypothetical protein